MKKTFIMLMIILAMMATILNSWYGFHGNEAGSGADQNGDKEEELNTDVLAGAPQAGQGNLRAGTLQDEPAGTLQDEPAGTLQDEPAGTLQDKPAGTRQDEAGGNAYLIDETGKTVMERILAPEGYERVELEKGSFGEYLRNLPLKPHGSKVRYYDGRAKPLDVHEAVIDIDVGSRDLQQCADSVIRLRAEYLYGKGLYERIHFNFTNGFNAEYSKWMKGYRIKVIGDTASWVMQTSPGNDYAGFRKYLDMVFAYAGTLSLEKEMKQTSVGEMQPGDVFLEGGTPGHCVIVLDMVRNRETGDKMFIIAQGYMPAQEMHVLKNPANGDGNPWYPLNSGDELVTPEWTFKGSRLFRFAD